MTTNTNNELLLGIDGGGSSTIAWLAERVAGTAPDIIGRGAAGPSNAQVIGETKAFSNIDTAVDAAFADAKQERREVRCACLALAGVDRPREHETINAWAKQRELAEDVVVTNDALPVLHALCGPGPGIALIAGTGSLCIGRDPSGNVLRCGGWGYRLGDEGSGYWIAMRALRAVVRAIDGQASRTTLQDALFAELEVRSREELVSVVYSPEHDRSRFASLSPLVFSKAQGGDQVAQSIVKEAATELSDLVLTVASRCRLDSTSPIAATGGILSHHPSLIADIETRLSDSGFLNAKLTLINDPVAGAIAIAEHRLL